MEGIRAAGRTYVFFVSGWHHDTRSYDHQVLGHFGPDTMRTGRFGFDQKVETRVLPERQRGQVSRLRLPVRRRQPVSRQRGAAGSLPLAGDRRPQKWRYLGPAAQTAAACPGLRAPTTPARSSTTPCPALASFRAPRPEERLFPHGLQLRRQPRRPPARVLPADGTPALGTVEPADPDLRCLGGRQRLRRYPALLDRRRDESRRRPRRARPPLRPRHVRRRVRALPDPALLPLGGRTPLDRLRPLQLEPVQSAPHADRPRPARFHGRPAGPRRRPAAPDDPQRHLRRRHQRLEAPGHAVSCCDA